jgi:hypothetical protein
MRLAGKLDWKGLKENLSLLHDNNTKITENLIFYSLNLEACIKPSQSESREVVNIF